MDATETKADPKNRVIETVAAGLTGVVVGATAVALTDKTKRQKLEQLLTKTRHQVAVTEQHAKETLGSAKKKLKKKS